MEEITLTIKLFDGFIFDYGLYPLAYAKGYSIPSSLRIYVCTATSIKHEIYYSLISHFLGIDEGAKEVFCNEDCFATHAKKYNPHSGLCKKHFDLIKPLSEEIELNLRNKLYCHPLLEPDLKREVELYESEFELQTNIRVRKISFERGEERIKDGTWLYIFEDRDEIASKYSTSKARKAKMVFKLFSIRPYRNLDEFKEYTSTTCKEKVSSSEAAKFIYFPLLLIKQRREIAFSELHKALKIYDKKSLILLLEHYEHQGFVERDDLTYKITENGTTFLKFIKSLFGDKNVIFYIKP